MQAKQKVQLLDLAPSSWFSQREGSSLWISGYRMLHVKKEDLLEGPKIVDLDRVRGVLLLGTINYLDASEAKIEIISETEGKMDASLIKKKDTPEGAYLLLLTPATEGDEPGARDRIKATVGLLAVINGRNIVYQHVFENIIDPSDGKLSAFGPVFENPNWFEGVDASQGRIDFIAAVGNAIAALPESDRNRTYLSLRWIESAIYDSGVSAFLKYWFAIETLGMPNTTDIRPLNEKLSVAYRLSYEEAKRLFNIGRLFGLRSRIVHEGQIVPIHGQLLRYLESIYGDLLAAYLGLSCERKAVRVIDQADFNLNQYLHEL